MRMGKVNGKTVPLFGKPRRDKACMQLHRKSIEMQHLTGCVQIVWKSDARGLFKRGEKTDLPNKTVFFKEKPFSWMRSAQMKRETALLDAKRSWEKLVTKKVVSRETFGCFMQQNEVNGRNSQKRAFVFKKYAVVILFHVKQRERNNCWARVFPKRFLLGWKGGVLRKSQNHH